MYDPVKCTTKTTVGNTRLSEMYNKNYNGEYTIMYSQDYSREYMIM